MIRQKVHHSTKNYSTEELLTKNIRQTDVRHTNIRRKEKLDKNTRVFFIQNYWIIFIFEQYSMKFLFYKNKHIQQKIIRQEKQQHTKNSTKNYSIIIFV